MNLIPTLTLRSNLNSQTDLWRRERKGSDLAFRDFGRSDYNWARFNLVSLIVLTFSSLHDATPWFWTVDFKALIFVLVITMVFVGAWSSIFAFIWTTVSQNSPKIISTVFMKWETIQSLFRNIVTCFLNSVTFVTSLVQGHRQQILGPLWPHLGGSPGLVCLLEEQQFSKSSVYSPFSDVTIIMKDGKL